MPTELQTLLVKDLAAWSHWLLQHANTCPGVWLVMAKKGTTTPTSLTLAQALDEALCFGWINGQAKSRDAATVMQRYTPRALRSTWSQINQGHVARLEKEGRMQARGWAEVEKAKEDGRWEAAYGAFSSMQAPEELMREIEKVPEAKLAWEGLTKTERYGFVLRLVNLKTEKGKERCVARTVEALVGSEAPGSAKVSKRKRGEVAEMQDQVEVDPVAVPESRAERAERRSRRLREGEADGL